MSALTVRGIDVAFGGVKALDGFELEVPEGEIHGLIGPNGAGKTTALNVIAEIIAADRGVVQVGAHELPVGRRKLVGLGLARTFQTPVTFNDLDTVENVMVGGYSTSAVHALGAFLQSRNSSRDERRLRARASELLEQVGFAAPLDSRVTELPFGALRQIELARALMSEPTLLLLDEVTSGLGPHETAEISALLRGLREPQSERAPRGRTIVLVEHDVPFVFELCDQVTSMDGGRVIVSGTPEVVRANPEVVASYLGPRAAGEAEAEVVRGADRRAPQASALARSDALEIEQLVSGYGGTVVLDRIDMSVRPGEIVAIIGANGAGKSTLLNTITGAPRARAGSVGWDGEDVSRWSTSRVVRAGIGLVPQDGAILRKQTVEENLRLATVGFHVRMREIQSRIETLLEDFPRLARRRTGLAGSLSGGERQMLAIAKVLMQRPRLLMLDEPSAGLAPSVVDQFAQLIIELNAGGLAVLVAEQHAAWLAPLVDRVYVLERGRVTSVGSAELLTATAAIEDHYLGARQEASASSNLPGDRRA